MNQKNIKIKYIADLYTGNSIPDSDKDKYVGRELPYISSKDINVDNNKIDYDNGMSTNISDGFKIASSNSVLLCIEGGSAGRKIAYLNKDVSFVNKLCCFKSKNVDSKYLYYSLKADSFTSRFNEMLNGMIGGVSIYNLNNIKIPIVDKKFQYIITKYLDKRIDNIDKSIENETKLIDELVVYKKTLITEVITQGINKKVKLKNSGIKWMGDINSNYVLKRMKYVADFDNGLTYSPKDEMTDSENGVLVLRSSNIQNGKLDFNDCVYVKLKNVPMLNKDNVLICSRNGSADLIGKNVYIDEDNKYSFGAFMMVARPKEGINGKYLYYILNSNIFEYYISSFLTTTINQLTKRSFGSMVTPICEDEKEQKEIVKYLDEKCSSIDKLIELKEKKIELLNKYKKSLIYECVTGKRKINV